MWLAVIWRVGPLIVFFGEDDRVIQHVPYAVKREPKTAGHLFCTCRYTSQVWLAVLTPLAGLALDSTEPTSPLHFQSRLAIDMDQSRGKASCVSQEVGRRPDLRRKPTFSCVLVAAWPCSASPWGRRPCSWPEWHAQRASPHVVGRLSVANSLFFSERYGINSDSISFRGV
jgi:hypothetical protein